MSFDILRTPNRVVSFDTVPTAILPRTYTNVTVVGIVGYAVAIGIEDITAKFQQLIPYINDINPDFTKAEYAIVKHNTNELEVLALPWIEEGTIVTSSVINKVVTLYDVSSTDDVKISKMLRLAGFSKFMIRDA